MAASAVIAGTGTNDTAATIAATRRAAELGADAALVVAPYYNRPDGRMLEAHFRAVADEGDLPDRRLQRPVPDRRERGRRHVPAPRRAPAGRSRSRRRAATWSRSPASAGSGRATWRSWPATTPGRCRCSRSGATASCPWRATRSRASSSRCAPRPAPATGRRPGAPTNGGCPCSSRNFAGRPEPRPGEGGPGRSWACSMATPCARRFCRWTRTGERRWRSPLRTLGLVEAGGGRMGHGAAGGRRMTTSTRRSTDVAAILRRPGGRPRPGRQPDPAAPDGWRVDPDVKAAILAAFGDRTTIDWTAGPLTFRDRAAVPPRDLTGGPWRIVPGGTAVRRGAHLARRRRRHAAELRQCRRVGRRGHHGRFARARRQLRPDRGAGPPRRPG